MREREDGWWEGDGWRKNYKGYRIRWEDRRKNPLGKGDRCVWCSGWEKEMRQRGKHRKKLKGNRVREWRGRISSVGSLGPPHPCPLDSGYQNRSWRVPTASTIHSSFSPAAYSYGFPFTSHRVSIVKGLIFFVCIPKWCGPVCTIKAWICVSVVQCYSTSLKKPVLCY